MALLDSTDDFVKSGPYRLEDAEELMQQPTSNPQQSNASTRHLRGAMYLAGYAVECLVKAYLIEQEQCKTLTKAQDKINQRRLSRGEDPIDKIASSAAGHDIYYLLGLTNLSTQPGYDAVLWSRLTQWKSTWRYEHDTPRKEDADRFLQDVRTAVNWLKPKIITS